MQAAQSTFISSTFWTERIGPSAALKTLEVMERESSWEKITRAGNLLRRGWQELAESHKLTLEFNGISALPGFSFASANHLKYKTLMTQEMLKRGYLATTACYLSLAHSDDMIRNYLEDLDPVFKLISDCELDRCSVDDLLAGPVCHSGFARLN
jgi:glutamate-1-semialdehyde aminotransferase